MSTNHKTYQFAFLFMIVIILFLITCIIVSTSLSFKRKKDKLESEYKAKESAIFNSMKQRMVGPSIGGAKVARGNLNVGVGNNSPSLVEAFDRINRDPRYVGVYACKGITIPNYKKRFEHDINLGNQIRLYGIKCSDLDWAKVCEKLSTACDSLRLNKNRSYRSRTCNILIDKNTHGHAYLEGWVNPLYRYGSVEWIEAEARQRYNGYGPRFVGSYFDRSGITGTISRGYYLFEKLRLE